MTKKGFMRAVVFKEVGKVVIEERPIPTIQHPGEAILKVTTAGLCGSDLHWYRGHQKIPAGFIPGHEFVGTVHAIGDGVKNVKTGQTVVATFSTQCGKCFYCVRKQTSRCTDSYLFGHSANDHCIDGGQAEYVRVPYADSTLVRAPRAIPARLLILMGDIFPTGFFAASRFLRHMDPAEARQAVVAVIGCGPVGICAIAVARTWCDTVYAVDMVPERLAEAARLGAKTILLDQPDKVAGAIKAATEGRGADVVLEVVGRADALDLALQLVRPFGQISSVGVHTQTLRLDGPGLYGKNVTIAWGRCPVGGVFEDALACLAKVQDQVAFLCEHQMALDRAPEAYELFAARKVHKILLIP